MIGYPTMTDAEVAEWTAAMRTGGQRAHEIANGDRAPAYGRPVRVVRPLLVSKTTKSQPPSTPVPADPARGTAYIADVDAIVDALMEIRR